MSPLSLYSLFNLSDLSFLTSLLLQYSLAAAAHLATDELFAAVNPLFQACLGLESSYSFFVLEIE
jgi:hypothetical protein